MEEFLRLIIPEEGYKILWVRVSTDHSYHRVFEKFSEMAAAAKQLNQEGHQVYHACASFKQSSYKGQNGKTKRRTQENVALVQSLWLDIDCSEDKARKEAGYIDQNEALAALDHFLKITKLPEPMVVSSGYGLHVYWLLTEAIEKTTWQAAAEILATSANSDKAKLLVDPARTTDAASVLRPIGTHNKKIEGIAPEVKLLREGAPNSIEVINSILGKFSGTYASKKANHSVKNDDKTNNEKRYFRPNALFEGERNSGVLAYIGSIRAKGHNEAEILEMARDFNSGRCQPALNDEEIVGLAARYKAETLNSTSEHSAWPKPESLEGELPPAPEFDYDLLPKALVSFVNDSAERMGQPPDFFAIPLMIISAAVLGSNWAICPRAKDKSWRESAVLWGGIVARPGSKKSPCLEACLKPIKNIEKQLFEKFEQDQIAYKFEKSSFEKNKNSEEFLAPPMEPKLQRAVIQDATYQVIARIMSESPEGLLASWDELGGMLASWDQKGQEAARSFYLTAWNGNQSYTVDRVERGTDRIERAFLCVLGGTQPAIIGQHIHKAKIGKSSDDGLVQRLQLLVFPDMENKPGEVERAENEQAKQLAFSAIQGLRSIDPLKIGVKPFNDEDRSILHFDEEAQKAYDEFRRFIENRVVEGKEDDTMSAHLNKLPATVAKLAMLIHLIDQSYGDVDKETTLKAIRFGKYLYKSAKRVYFSADVGIAEVATILGKRLKAGAMGDRFTVSEVKKKGWGKLRETETIEAAVAALVAAGWIRKMPLENSLGRPTDRYIINPQITGE